MSRTISAAAWLRKSQALLQSGKIKNKTTELVLRDKNQSIKKAKENELEFGLRPDHTKIGLYSDPDGSYAFRKHLKNPLAGSGYIDLTLTGATNRSLFTKQFAAGFVFDANTKQWDVNIGRYGKDIQGLNQKTFEKIQFKEHAPELADFINEELGLK